MQTGNGSSSRASRPWPYPWSRSRSPTNLEVRTRNGSRIFLVGGLGPGGQDDKATVPVTKAIVDGRVTKISYEADTGGQTAVVTTSVSDIGEAGTVGPPAGT